MSVAPSRSSMLPLHIGNGVVSSVKRWSATRSVTVGACSAVVLTLASAMRGWPFPSLTAEPWLFQINGTTAFARYGALAVFYAAAAGMCVAWIAMLHGAREGRVSTKHVYGAFGLWSAILFFATPLFSGDVYVYFVDGEAIQRGFDPYEAGVSSMGAIPSVHMVHSLWRDTTTMYGPIFVRLVQGISVLTDGNLIAGVMVLRALAIASVAVAAFSMQKMIARFGRSVPEGLVFAILNPLTMLHLVGGAHNDAQMLGLLSAGLALGLCCKNWGLRAIALALCAAAGAFKIPGFAGALILGWVWAGAHTSIFRRMVVSGAAGLGALAWFEVQTLATGLGWGWTSASNVPGLAHPLLAPSNAVALSFGGLVGQGYELNALTRPVALLIAALVSVWLIVRTGRDVVPYKVVRAFGWALFLIAWAGPAVYPWYLAWGAAIVGAMGTASMRKPLIVTLCAVVFLVAPGGYGILDIPGASWRVVMAFLTTAVMSWVVWHIISWNHVEVRRSFTAMRNAVLRRSALRVSTATGLANPSAGENGVQDALVRR